MTKNKTLEIQVEDSALVKEVKEIYILENNLDCTIDKIRMFFYGGELNDTDQLFQYSIKDGIKINLMIREEIN